MRITPLEIRQKTFERNFRGYEREEVHAFLMTLSQEWERIVDENKELRFKYEATEREIQKLREVESSLYKTLKTAEDTGASVIEQARKAADLHLKESQLKAEQLINEAKTRAQDTIEESEMRAKQIVADMEDRLKVLLEQYKRLESTRDDLLGELKRMAGEVLEKVDRARQSMRQFDPDSHLSEVRREAGSGAFPGLDFDKTDEVKVKAEESETPVTVPAEPAPRVQKSFFDQIS